MEQRTIRLLLTAFIFLATSFITRAQFGTDLKKIAEEYSNHNGVYLKDRELYTIDIKGDSLSVVQNVSELVFIMSENVIPFSGDRIYYSSFSRIEDLDAKVHLPAGKGFKTLKVNHFQEGHSTDNSIFYDDVRAIDISYPMLEQGSVTSVNYKRVFNNPRFPGKFFFQKGLPAVDLGLTLKVHRDINIDYRIINADKAAVNFQSYSKGKYKYYEWTASSVKPYKTENASDYFLYYSPHIICYITDYKINGESRVVYNSPRELYHFYYNNLSDLTTGCTDELKALAVEITSGKPGKLEKAGAILYWVQDNIKYVAYEEGMRGFIPDSPDNVLQKRFGDCKDMTSLIRQLGECAGIESYYSWIGTDDIPYTYEEVPTIVTDNHMVAALNINDSLYVLDATTDQLEISCPPARLQGKEMLVGLGEDDYKIVKIPRMPAEYSKISDSVAIAIEGSSIKGTGRSKYEGYNRWELAYRLDGVAEDKVSKSMINVLSRGNNKFFLDKVSLSPYRSREPEIYVEYEFHVDEYVSNLGSEIYVNPNVDRDFQGMFVDSSKADIPVVNNFSFTKSYIIRIQVPPGYETTYVPQDSGMDNDKFAFDINYLATPEEIILRKNFRMDFSLLKIEDFKAWNEMIEKLGKSYRETIVFEKIKNLN